MSRSKAASARSRTRIGCSRTSGAATRPCRSCRWRRFPSSSRLAVDRVMSEGSLYDRELAALAIKQARGDLIEAIFLLRAFRATLAALRHERADRHRRDGRPPAHLGGVQGSARRPGAGADLRLHPSAARSRAGGTERRAGAGDRDAAGATPMPRVTDLLAADDLIEPSPAADARQAGRRSHARAAGVSGRARPAPAESRARRRRIPAGARLFDPARLRPHASVRRRDPARRGRGRVLRRGGRLRRAARPHHRDRVPDDQPVPRLGDRGRRNSRAAMGWCSATASARR